MSKVLYIYSRNAWKEWVLPWEECKEERLFLPKEQFLTKESEELILYRQEQEWHFRKTKFGKIWNKKEEFFDKPLQDHMLLRYKTMHNEVFIILVRELEMELYPCKKYCLPENGKVSIGENEDNTICYYYQNLVSHYHCSLVGKNGVYTVINNSQSGIYINGKWMEEPQELQYGDQIHVMGLELVYLGDVLSIEPRIGQIEGEVKLCPFKETRENSVIYNIEKKDKFVYRSPRFLKKIEKKYIKIDSLKEYTVTQRKKQGVAFSLFPSVRKKLYEEYLQQKNEEIQEAWREIRVFMDKQCTAVSDSMEKVRREECLWGQTRQQEDFLKYRIGTKFTADSDYIQVECSKEVEERICVETQMPVQIDLQKDTKIGVCGSPDFVMQVEQILVGQIAANNSYTEVKIGFFMEREEYDAHKYIKWLPHLWSEDWKNRYLAADSKETDKVIAAIKEEWDRKHHQPTGTSIYYILFVTEEALRKNKIWQDASLFQEENVTIVFLAGQQRLLPYFCQYIFDQEESGVVLDPVSKDNLEIFVKELCPLRIKEGKSHDKIPEQVDLLDLFHGEMSLREVIQKNWNRNSVIEGINVPIGKTGENTYCMIDFHEKGYGPHGLIGGTTGSGKSELLETMILSLAAHYSPEEINFFIIDYKGAGMSQGIKDIPHITAQISNLSGTTISRALISIKSENVRRQQMFYHANVNHIDDYIRLYRQHRVEKPLPHLFLIVDEFARLKEEEPEFMKELIGISQVGRSLGIHLILATQKPGGTVDDNIWSNADFHICLRVQTPGDSMDMLQKEDAFYLNRSGMGYFQVGKKAIYRKFQCAYGGSEYSKRRKKGVILLDNTGHSIMENRRHWRWEDPTLNTGKVQKEILREEIKKQANMLNMEKQRAIWLPELAKKVYQKDLYQKWERKGRCEVPVGLVDDPENQAQYPLYLDFTQCGNIAVCGSIGTGKSTMVQTMLYGIIKNYLPQEVQIYGMDFGLGRMEAFQKAPHVVEILGSGQGEKIEALLEHLKEEVKKRKELLKGGDFVQYNAFYEEKMPAILVFIDHYAGFSEETDHYYEEDMIMLTKEGVACGIYFIITGNGFGRSDINRKVGENMNRVLSFFFPDKYTYGEIFHTGKLEEFPDIDTEGRGVLKQRGKILLFQSAFALEAPNDFARMKRIEQEIMTVGEKV